MRPLHELLQVDPSIENKKSASMMPADFFVLYAWIHLQQLVQGGAQAYIPLC